MKTIQIITTIDVTCSDEYAAKLLKNPSWESSQKCFRNNQRFVHHATAQSVEYKVYLHHAISCDGDSTYCDESDKDANEIVVWVASEDAETGHIIDEIEDHDFAIGDRLKAGELAENLVRKYNASFEEY